MAERGMRLGLCLCLVALTTPSVVALAFMSPAGHLRQLPVWLKSHSTSATRPATLVCMASKPKPSPLGPGLFDPNIQLGPEEAWIQQSETGSKQRPLLSRDQVQTLFVQIDVDSNGLIDAEELHTFALSIGEKWTVGQSVAVLRAIDADKNGLISLDEVYGWYSSGQRLLPAPDQDAGENQLTRQEVV